MRGQWVQLGLTLSLLVVSLVSVAKLQELQLVAGVSEAAEGVKAEHVPVRRQAITFSEGDLAYLRGRLDESLTPTPTMTPVPTATATPSPTPTVTPSPIPAVVEEKQVKLVEAAPSNVDLEGIPGEMIGAHNTARSSVGVGGLSWSADLAVSAQGWADVLKGEGCQGRHDTGNPDGENIYWKWQTGRDGQRGLISSATEVVNSWVNERNQYDYGANSCSGVCGHYTQVVWRNTTEVGCGVSSCYEGDKQTDVWVCRYRPAGNWVGEKPY